MLAKPTDQQCVDIVKQCVAYMSENCLHEKGLFRVSSSMNDVRRLKLTMSEGRRRTGSDNDSHVLAGVLISTLKDMELPLLHEIREDILEIDANDESEENINGTAKCIAKLPTQKIEMFRVISSMIRTLGVAASNDSSVPQLVTALAPVIYRPTDTSYMSIRHVEMLKHVRPILQFIAENNVAIFRNVGPSKYQQPSTGASRLNASSSSQHLNSRMRSSSGGGSSEDDVDFRTFTPLSSSSFKSGISPVPDLSQGVVNNFSAGLKLSLQTQSDMTMEVDVGQDDAAIPSSTSLHAPVPNYSSWEWRLLESLVCSRVQTWLVRGGSGWNAGVDDESIRTGKPPSESSPVISLQSHFSDSKGGRGGVGMGDMHLCDSDEDDGDGLTGKEAFEHSGEHTHQSAKISHTHRQHPSGERHRGGRSEARRKLISECKMLRQEIQHFEEQWQSEHRRPPQPQDRGTMQHSYSRYKYLKKLIRDQAGTDIQRVVRGYIVRKNLHYMRAGHKQDFGGPMDVAGASGAKASGSTAHSFIASGLQMRAEQKPTSNAWFQSGGAYMGSNEGRGGDMVSGDEDLATDDERGTPLISDRSMESQKAAELQSRYRECLEVKRTLKRNLKKFDDEFLARKGRNPRKADKEVMRPQYQKYHEIRAELDKLRIEITREMGHFPADLEDNSAPSATSDRLVASSTSAWQHGGGQDAKEHHYNQQHHQHQSIGLDSEDGGDDELALSGAGGGLKMQSPLRGGATIPGTAPSKTTGGVEALMTEKKQLHAYLKAFEKEFNRVNGRHVMHPEDIKPVADEYQRYKELKKVLKDMRSTL